jgi:GntR family transcriptional regulator, transcriptional repressor for pyruvate dehydrogenase complex
MMKNRARPSDRTMAAPPSDGSLRVSHKIVRELQNIIDHGELKPGALLPSERELASRFWVSRSSVREALSILETLGLVALEPGRRARILGTSTEPDKRLTRWQYASRFNENDVYELRLILESRAARLAAEKVTPQTIADLTRSLAAMKDCMREADLLAAAHEDFKFHDIIVVLSGNRLFAEIHHLNQEAILESQKLPLSRHKRLWEPVQEHERILKALEQRDPDGASYLMQLHIIKAADRVGITLKS